MIKLRKKLNGFAIFIEDLPRWSKPVPAICIHCDSQSAIDRAQRNMYNGKSRHIRRRHNSIRQLLSNGVVSIDYVKSKDKSANQRVKSSVSRNVVKRNGVEAFGSYWNKNTT